MLETLIKALAGGVIVASHGFIGVVLIGVTIGIDHLILYWNDGQEMMVYNWVPLSFLFQTIDVLLIGVFGFFGIVEAIRRMSE